MPAIKNPVSTPQPQAQTRSVLPSQLTSMARPQMSQGPVKPQRLTGSMPSNLSGQFQNGAPLLRPRPVNSLQAQQQTGLTAPGAQQGLLTGQPVGQTQQPIADSGIAPPAPSIAAAPIPAAAPVFNIPIPTAVPDLNQTSLNQISLTPPNLNPIPGQTNNQSPAPTPPINTAVGPAPAGVLGQAPPSIGAAPSSTGATDTTAAGGINDLPGIGSAVTSPATTPAMASPDMTQPDPMAMIAPTVTPTVNSTLSQPLTQPLTQPTVNTAAPAAIPAAPAQYTTPMIIKGKHNLWINLADPNGNSLGNGPTPQGAHLDANGIWQLDQPTGIMALAGTPQ